MNHNSNYQKVVINPHKAKLGDTPPVRQPMSHIVDFGDSVSKSTPDTSIEYKGLHLNLENALIRHASTACFGGRLVIRHYNPTTKRTYLQFTFHNERPHKCKDFFAAAKSIIKKYHKSRLLELSEYMKIRHV